MDDVVNAYEKLDEEEKSHCLEFLLGNHPTELLHPFTKEWKVKLEEQELGCDAPDEDSDVEDSGENQVSEWLEADGEEEEEEEEEDDDELVDVEEEEEDRAEESPEEETAEFWNQQWENAMKSSSEMEKYVERSVKNSTEYYKRQMEEAERAREESMGGGVTVEEMEREVEREREIEKEKEKGRMKSKIPPGLFLRAAVRPFTYRNLVKEIVLMRHAIVDGDISPS